MKLFVMYMNAHQRVTSVEEDINNPVDRMAHSMGADQPLFLPTPAITQWLHQQSGHSVRDGDYAWT